jgi:hypothetical protein
MASLTGDDIAPINATTTSPSSGRTPHDAQTEMIEP